MSRPLTEAEKKWARKVLSQLPIPKAVSDNDYIYMAGDPEPEGLGY